MNTENAAWLLLALAAYIIYHAAETNVEQRKTCQQELMPYNLPVSVVNRACNVPVVKPSNKG